MLRILKKKNIIFFGKIESYSKSVLLKNNVKKITNVQSDQPHRTGSPKRGSRVFSHFFPTLTCLGTDSQTTGAAKQGQEVAAMTWVSSKTQNMDLTEPWEKVQIFRRE